MEKVEGETVWHIIMVQAGMTQSQKHKFKFKSK